MIIISFICPCPKTGCSNHGICEECEKYHGITNSFPFCKRKPGLFTKVFYRKSYELLQKLKKEGKV